MADKDPPQSDEAIPLDCISTNLLPPQLHTPPMPIFNMTASQNGVAPRTFHRFSELPPELRIAIWEFSLPHRVHTFPHPSKKFDFLNNCWVQGQHYRAKPDIAQVCSEARAVAFSNGSAVKIWTHGHTRRSRRLNYVWVDSKRDMAVMYLPQAEPHARNLYRSLNNGHIYGLLNKKYAHITLDISWAGVCFSRPSWDPAREFYYDFVHGRTECDLVILSLHLDVNDAQAASTRLFGGLRANDSVLIPIDDTRRMSRLFDAQAKFKTVDWLETWKNFTQFRKPTNLFEFIQRWKKLAAREMRQMQVGLDLLTGARMETEGKDMEQIREQAARAAAIRAKHPKLRPVIMVSRGVQGSLWMAGNESEACRR